MLYIIKNISPYMFLIQSACNFRHLYVSNILKHTIVVLEIQKNTVLSHVKVNTKLHEMFTPYFIPYIIFTFIDFRILASLVVLASDKATFHLKSQQFLASIVHFTAR